MPRLSFAHLFPLVLALLVLSGCGGGGAGNAPTSPTVTIVAPSISSQPIPVSVTAPTSATFSATASGDAPLTYQWRRGGVDVAGATSSSYTIATTAEADNGANFTVRVSNAAGAVVSAGATLTVNGTLARDNMTIATVQRSYLAYRPNALPAAAVPLVIVLHGGTEDAALTASDQRPTKAWRDIADTEKMMIVYPDGLNTQWIDCRADTANVNPPDDIAFLSALIDRIAAQRAIDPARIYVTGVSNGGLMAYRVGLELSNKVAGIGAVIANNPAVPFASCPAAPARPLTVVMMNGTSDTIMPFGGGPVIGIGNRGTVISSNATRDYWRTTLGCASPAATQTLADSDVTDGSSVFRETWTGCSGGNSLVYFRVDGGGHTSPSKRYFTSSARQNRDIESAEEIWAVLKNARR